MADEPDNVVLGLLREIRSKHAWLEKDVWQTVRKQ